MPPARGTVCVMFSVHATNKRQCLRNVLSSCHQQEVVSALFRRIDTFNYRFVYLFNLQTITRRAVSGELFKSCMYMSFNLFIVQDEQIQKKATRLGGERDRTPLRRVEKVLTNFVNLLIFRLFYFCFICVRYYSSSSFLNIQTDLLHLSLIHIQMCIRDRY